MDTTKEQSKTAVAAIAKAQYKSDLLTRGEAASFLGVTVNTLNNWVSTKRYDLPYVKIGRLAKYKLSDLQAFIEERTVGGMPQQSAAMGLKEAA